MIVVLFLGIIGGVTAALLLAWFVIPVSSSTQGPEQP